MRGQIQQVFVFIIFVFIAGFVMYLGYKGVMTIITDSCESDKVAFGREVSALINKYDDYGSLHEEKLRLPCNARAIWFVDSRWNDFIEYPSTQPSPKDGIWDPKPEKIGQPAIYYATMMPDDEFNIFLEFENDVFEPVGLSDRVVTDEQLLDNAAAAADNNDAMRVRIPAAGTTATVTFKGLGDSTYIGGS